MNLDYSISGTDATMEELETALEAVQWDFHETEDDAAIASYKLARKLQGKLKNQYNDKFHKDVAALEKVDELWNKYAPRQFKEAARNVT
tara:strand:- start:3215 stop:3481 length:267 start_codon:yes stop_codon:yes gene_type:complete